MARRNLGDDTSGGDPYANMTDDQYSQYWAANEPDGTTDTSDYSGDYSGGSTDGSTDGSSTDGSTASPPSSGGIFGSLGSLFSSMFGHVTGTAAPPSAGSYQGQQNIAQTGSPSQPAAAPAPSGITGMIQANPMLAIGGVVVIALLLGSKR